VRQLYSYHIFFKVCKPLRGKYKLSVNCLLCLSGAFLYGSVLNRSFTRYSLLKFISYYDNVRIGKYMTVLISKGYIEESVINKGHQTYCVSDKGKQVIKELNESYDKELILFCSKYSIVL
jgi:hypothetical protein